MHLHLGSPLRFIPDAGLDPFAYDPRQGEALFCLTIAPPHYQSREPDPRSYLEAAAFAGRAEDALDPEGAASLPVMELPAGVYLFAQIRDTADKETLIRMSIELQREGLRQGRVLDRRVYLRRLYEDGSPVIQLFRPMEPPAS
jgi:hypothetical protein